MRRNPEFWKAHTAGAAMLRVLFGHAVKRRIGGSLDPAYFLIRELYLRQPRLYDGGRGAVVVRLRGIGDHSLD